MDNPLKYQFLDFIKIEYLSEFNFIKYTYGFLEELLWEIGKSNTIISLLNQICPGYENIFNKNLSCSFPLTIYTYKEGNSFTKIKRIYFYLLYTKNNKNIY